MKTLREMLAEARQVVPEEGPDDLQRRLKSDTPPVVIDVRDPDEYRDGHIEAATNISRGFLEFRVATADKPLTSTPSSSPSAASRATSGASRESRRSRTRS